MRQTGQQQVEGLGRKRVNYHKSGRAGFSAGIRSSVGHTWDSVESEGTGLRAVSCFRLCGADKRARPKSIGPMMGK